MTQQRFTPLERAAWGGLLKTHATLNKLLEAQLQSEFGITHVEYEILLRLNYAPGGKLRIQDLAEQSILTRSGVSRAVDRLEKAGFTTKNVAEEDRRGAYAMLTPEGKARFEKILDQHVAFVRATFLDLYSEEQLQLMADCWAIMAARHPEA